MPSDGFSVTYSINFDNGFPGEQHYFLKVTPASFDRQLSRARTFGFLRDVEMLRSIGKARGASMENAVALHDGKVLNPEGLRMPDEMVRHKMLDAVGDLSLAGAAIQGHLIVHKGGHELHRKLVSTLLQRTDAWSLVHPSGVREYPVYGGGQVAAMVAAHA
jgi:UDP-3-O-[3-hydroxymyristoyl] N-acetylglucosamine deacetylase